jgi:hypothetical protein
MCFYADFFIENIRSKFSEQKITEHDFPFEERQGKRNNNNNNNNHLTNK